MFPNDVSYTCRTSLSSPAAQNSDNLTLLLDLGSLKTGADSSSVCFHSILAFSWYSWYEKLPKYSTSSLHRCFVSIFGLYISLRGNIPLNWLRGRPIHMKSKSLTHPLYTGYLSRRLLNLVQLN